MPFLYIIYKFIENIVEEANPATESAAIQSNSPVGKGILGRWVKSKVQKSC